MSRLAVLVAALLSVVLLSTPVACQPEAAAALANDIAILNFALTLENTDSTFFSSFLAAFPATTSVSAQFTVDDFTAAGFNATVYAALTQLAQEELNHAAILSVTVAALGGTPAPKCTYNFSSVTSVVDYLTVGQLFENTGTSAYDGGINAITNSTLQEATATIATVEARHASYLNQLLGVVPFAPSGFDTALTPLEVYAIIAPFIVSCPNNFNITDHLPTIRPYGVSFDSADLNATDYTGPLASILTNNYTQDDLDNDLLALNYALSLENLEASFYNFTTTLFVAADFAAAGFNESVYYYFSTIDANENIHVSTLRTVITALGGTPLPVCNYAGLLASITTVPQYIATAAVLENTGVSAYDGAINAIASTVLQQVAATIATIEARHAAFLNLLSGVSPFPNTTDVALTPEQIVDIVSPLQICPYPPITPPSVARLQQPAATVVSPTGAGSSSGASSSSSTAFSSSASVSSVAAASSSSAAAVSSSVASVSSSSAPVTSVLGDPSFVGFHGQSFQVHGIPNRYFNLLSTSSVQFNALFTMLVDGQSMSAGVMKAARVSRQLSAAKLSKESSSTYPLPLTTAYSHEGTFLAVMALKLAGVAVYAAAGPYTQGFKTVTIAGSAVAVSSAAVEVAAGMYVTLQTPHILTIDTPAVSFTLANADHFFNIEQATLHQHYTADAQMDGLLGQTANEQWKVESSTAFKQHMVYDYLLADMDGFSDDFVSNLYQAPAVDATNEQ